MVTFDELKRRFIHLNNKDLLLAFDNTKPGMARDACATIILDRVNRYSTVDTLRVIVERDALRAQLAACKKQRDALMQMVYDGFTDDPANLCIILGEVEAGQIHDLIAAIDAERKQEVE